MNYDDYQSIYRKRKAVLGLDYGTFNSYMAFKIEDNPRPQIVNRDGYRSLFWTDGTQSYYCDDVTSRSLPINDPSRVISSPKLLIGKQETVNVGGRSYSVAEINGGIIEKVIQSALQVMEDEYIEEIDRHIVLGAPVTFGSEEKRMLRDSVIKLGFRCDIINEPSAAAVYITSALKVKLDTFLIMDFGAGTFDAAVMKRNPRISQDNPDPFVLEYQNGNRIAGDVCDELLAEVMLQKLKENPGTIDLIRVSDKSSAEYRQLLYYARVCKQDLSDLETNTITVTAGASGAATLQITRGEFENAIRDRVIMPALQIAGKVVEKSGLKNKSFKIILVGGSSRIPLFKKMTEEFFDWILAENILIHNPEQAVALGASLYCEEPAFCPKIMYGYAVRSYNRNHEPGLNVCIPSDVQLPYKVVLNYYTLEPNQTTAEFQFFQTADCALGDFFPFDGRTYSIVKIRHTFPYPVPQKTPIHLRVELGEDGILTLTAFDEIHNGKVTNASVDLLNSYKD